MRIKNVNLEWYVLLHDFNKDKIIKYNVLNDKEEEIANRIKKSKITTYKEFKESMTSMFRAQYWSRTEYEILVSGLHTKSEPEKIDVWYQIEINLDNILQYIINKMKIELTGGNK